MQLRREDVRLSFRPVKFLQALVETVWTQRLELHVPASLDRHEFHLIRKSGF
jgi:hypothetical protein